ncbi:EAL domain-containing protein [Emcibacter nanhaiensis]|uniref:EAL domain-containing protein n=1 Tax=Emcibacter nanhaiensis TaxID=1505037 RepID=A0A501PHG9_9PROT|nr:EAL domain-containing protein [Emcibacter nanhaiensis]TPD59537.1 EAL domain-containing protein [Emcibacter nanhaiensis]
MEHIPSDRSLEENGWEKFPYKGAQGAYKNATQGFDPLLKLAIEASPNAIGILDYRDELKVVEANVAFAQMLQRDYEDVLGIHPWDWDAEAGRDQILEAAYTNGFHEGGVRRIETVWRRQDGTLVQVQVDAVPFSLHGKAYVYVDCRERSQVDGVESYSSIDNELRVGGFESARDGIAVVSLEKLKIVKVNAALTKMLGQEPSKLVGAWLSDWDTQYIQAVFANSPNHNGKLTISPVYQTQLKRADGGHVDAEVSASCFTLDGQLFLNIVYRDIGWRTKLERRLEEANRRFHTYIQATKRFISVYTLEGKLLTVNSIVPDFATTALWAKSNTLLWEEDCWIDTGDRKRVRRKFMEAAAGGSVRFEVNQRDAQGDVQQREIHFEPIENENGIVILVLARNNDISDLKETQSALREASDLASITISSMTEGLIRTDAEGVVRLCNGAAARIIGADANDIIGKKAGSVYSIFDRTTGRQMADPVDEALKGRPSIDFNKFINLTGIEGNSRIITLSCVCLPSSETGPAGAVLVLRDAAELVALTEHLNWLATHDEQTSLLNHRGFTEHLEVARRTITDQNPACLLFLDLDKFKVINDSCGREAGDRMLENIVWVILTSIREDDIVGRVGSDEFAILLRGLSLDKARAVAERLLEAIEGYRFLHDTRFYSVSASGGMTVLDRPEVQSEVLMSEALAACEVAQQEGRGRLHVFRYDDSSIVEARQAVDWFNYIQEGLSEHRFELFLQKVVSPERKILGYEALIRIQDENGNVIPPGVFMPAARRYNMMTKINEEVIAQATKLVNDDLFPKDGRYLAINIGAASLSDRTFRGWVLERLSGDPKTVQRLMIEITETDEVHWSPAEIDFVLQLRLLGVPVYLDDFGTGYNSFDLLKTLTVDGIKIERTLVADILSSPVDQAIVSAACSIAESLDINLVVEGVETEEVFEELKQLGVPRFQGYLFHKPTEAKIVLEEDSHVDGDSS